MHKTNVIQRVHKKDVPVLSLLKLVLDQLAFNCLSQHFVDFDSNEHECDLGNLSNLFSLPHFLCHPFTRQNFRHPSKFFLNKENLSIFHLIILHNKNHVKENLLM